MLQDTKKKGNIDKKQDKKYGSGLHTKFDLKSLIFLGKGAKVYVRCHFKTYENA